MYISCLYPIFHQQTFSEFDILFTYPNQDIHWNYPNQVYPLELTIFVKEKIASNTLCRKLKNHEINAVCEKFWKPAISLVLQKAYSVIHKINADEGKPF